MKPQLDDLHLFSFVITGVLGGLSAWGADMDIIVTVIIVMAIGLTVDYAAHINYHYFMANFTLPSVERMATSLETIAYPTSQVNYPFLIKV